MTKATVAQTATPGPWRIDPDDDSIWRILGPGERGQWNNEIGELAYTGGNAEANARLIAAAPDLLAALEELAQSMSKSGIGFSAVPSELRSRVRAAIAATRGDAAQEAGL